jgi:hypothetical protein
MNIQSESNILEQALAAAGGVSALSARLGLTPNVISNWKSRGVPTGWTAALTVMAECEHGIFSKVKEVTSVTTSDGTVCTSAHASD